MIIISAVAKNNVIGRNNSIPWHIPEDFKLFKDFTSGNTVIYGRKTFESLGSKPLPNRHNIVVTKTKIEGMECYPSLKEAVEAGKKYGKDIFFCGGSRIYKEAMEFADMLYISHVHAEYQGDTYFPEITPDWQVVESKEFKDFTFKKYKKIKKS